MPHRGCNLPRFLLFVSMRFPTSSPRLPNRVGYRAVLSIVVRVYHPQVYLNPAVAGPDTHTIKYLYTSSTGKNNSTTQTIHVYAPPVASFSVSSPLCENEPSRLPTFPTALRAPLWAGAGISGWIPVGSAKTMAIPLPIPMHNGEIMMCG